MCKVRDCIKLGLYYQAPNQLPLLVLGPGVETLFERRLNRRMQLASIEALFGISSHKVTQSHFKAIKRILEGQGMKICFNSTGYSFVVDLGVSYGIAMCDRNRFIYLEF